MQLDNPERGFSYKTEGPLDLRMNPLKGIPAWKRLRQFSEDELTGMLEENADEPFAAEIARTIVRDLRQGIKVETTTALHQEVVKALQKVKVPDRKEAVKKSSARTFQALRIAVNDELRTIEQAIPSLIALLNEYGRLAVISFHSLEDRLVKQAFKRESTNCLCPPEQPVCTCGHKASVRILTSKPVTASPEEVESNPRSRSAKLRVVEKL